MSWEGYYQHLCRAGHAFASDPDYGGFQAPPICPDCSQPPEFTNVVDQTNGCDFGVPANEGKPCSCGRLELVLVTPAVIETCNLGYQHEKVPPTYKFGEVHKIRVGR